MSDTSLHNLLRDFSEDPFVQEHGFAQLSLEKIGSEIERMIEEIEKAPALSPELAEQLDELDQCRKVYLDLIWKTEALWGSQSLSNSVDKLLELAGSEVSEEQNLFATPLKAFTDSSEGNGEVLSQLNEDRDGEPAFEIEDSSFSLGLAGSEMGSEAEVAQTDGPAYSVEESPEEIVSEVAPIPVSETENPFYRRALWLENLAQAENLGRTIALEWLFAVEFSLNQKLQAGVGKIWSQRQDIFAVFLEGNRFTQPVANYVQGSLPTHKNYFVQEKVPLELMGKAAHYLCHYSGPVPASLSLFEMALVTLLAAQVVEGEGFKISNSMNLSGIASANIPDFVGALIYLQSMKNELWRPNTPAQANYQQLIQICKGLLLQLRDLDTSGGNMT